MAHYLVKVYDGSGKEIRSQWFESRGVPFQQAGQLTRELSNGVSHDIFFNGEESVFPTGEIKGSKGERDANAS